MVDGAEEEVVDAVVIEDLPGRRKVAERVT